MVQGFANNRWAALGAGVARLSNARRAGLALACIVLASFAFRLHVARECSLWLDEVSTHLDALRPWPVVLQGPSREHPPLMYVLVKLAMDQFGASEPGVRAVSLFFGCVLLVATYELCVELGLTAGRALVVVATLALCPFFIQHTTEARQYAMLAALVTLATTRALRLLQGRPRGRDLAGFVVCASAAAYTHYFGLAYGAALLGALIIGIAPAWRQSSPPRRAALIGSLSVLLVVLGCVAERAAALGRHYAVGKGGAQAGPVFNTTLLHDIPSEFSLLTNHTVALAIEPGLALIGLLLLTWRLRGVARLLPLGLGLLPCAAVMFVSAQHFLAPRYIVPSAIWYHLGACVALFALADRVRWALPEVGRARWLSPVIAGLALASVLAARLDEYPTGFGAGTDDYRALQRYFVAHLAHDTALVAYNGYFGEILFGKEYRVGSRPIRLEAFRRVPGIDRYLVVEIHMDDERRPELESLVHKKFGLSAQEWRALPLIALPRSTYQYTVPARIVQLPHEKPDEPPPPERRKKRPKSRLAP